MANCVSHDLFHAGSQRGYYCFLEWFIMLLTMMCSKSLLVTDAWLNIVGWGGMIAFLEEGRNVC